MGGASGSKPRGRKAARRRGTQRQRSQRRSSQGRTGGRGASRKAVAKRRTSRTSRNSRNSRKSRNSRTSRKSRKSRNSRTSRASSSRSQKSRQAQRRSNSRTSKPSSGSSLGSAAANVQDFEKIAKEHEQKMTSLAQADKQKSQQEIVRLQSRIEKLEKLLNQEQQYDKKFTDLENKLSEETQLKKKLMELEHMTNNIQTLMKTQQELAGAQTTTANETENSPKDNPQRETSPKDNPQRETSPHDTQYTHAYSTNSCCENSQLQTTQPHPTCTCYENQHFRTEFCPNCGYQLPYEISRENWGENSHYAAYNTPYEIDYDERHDWEIENALKLRRKTRELRELASQVDDLSHKIEVQEWRLGWF